MADPRFTVEYTQHPTYLIARVTGTAISVDIKLAYFAEIARECRTRGLRKLMVVESLPGNISFGDMARLAAEVAPLLKGLICTYVDTVPGRHEVNRLGEDISIDAGAVGRMFRTEAEAEKWISLVP